MKQGTAKKIFVGLGGGVEDVLHMTFVAHQLKMEMPEAEITWAIGRPYAHLLDNNSDIRHVLPVEGDWRTEGWRRICELAETGDYDHKILFHDPSRSLIARPDCPSRLDCILKAAGIHSWLPRRPVLVPREADVGIALDFVKANRLLARNQRILAMEIHPDLLPSPWPIDDYRRLLDLLSSRLEMAILLCRGGGLELGPTIDHDEITDARVLTVHQTVALLAQIGDVVVGARGGLTLMALAAGNTAPKLDLAHPQGCQPHDGLAACGYDSAAQLVVPKSPEEVYDEIIESMSRRGRLPLGRPRKYEEVPMNTIPDSDYYNPGRDPLISVLLLVRDTETELEGCLENIFGQDLDGYLEVIVLDSGSNQNEARVVERLKGKYHRLRYLRSAREQRYATINRGIKPARGRYLFLMDPRNRLRPGALGHLANYLDAHPEVAMVWGDDELLQNPEAAREENPKARLDISQAKDGNDLLSKKRLSPHILWRSILHHRFGMFNSSFDSAGDYEFALRVARHYPVHYVPVSVGIIKQSPDSTGNRGAVYEAEAENVRRLYQSIADGKNHGNTRRAHAASPAISIILTTWGQQELLSRALTSIQRQSWTDYEVVIVNCSKESLENKVEDGPFGERAKYVRMQPDSCEAVAWNAGLAVASGQWIAFLQDGGSYYPHHLGSLLQAARDSRHPIVYAGTERIEGLFQNGTFSPLKREHCPALPFEMDRLLVQNFLHLQAMLVETRCFRSIGHFDPMASPLSDWELALRLAEHFTLHPVDKTTSELWCSPPGIEEILAYERIYARQSEFIEYRPEIVQARQKVLDNLCRQILGVSERGQRSRHGLPAKALST
jgi:glycosyltransferase involved in cell wall biosynthesis